MSDKNQTILTVLSGRMGRKEVEWLRDMALQDKAVFDYCFQLIFQQEERTTAWHAAWVTEKVSEQALELFTDRHIRQLENFTLENNHSGLQRLSLSILFNLPLLQPISVAFINLCFEQMISLKEPVGVQMLSMKMLGKICDVEPDFAPELILTLENVDDEFYSKGFWTGKRNMLNRLKKRM